MSDSKKSWEKFLHPGTLRGNLISISLYITAFEIFKSKVVEKPLSFFTVGIDANGPVIDPDYKTEVLSKNKSLLYASLYWLKELGAIDQSDIDTFDSIRGHRNELAHEPFPFITSHERNIDLEKFKLLISLFSKIERWWVLNFELSVNPDMLPEGADPEAVIPGVVWNLQLLLEIALGNEPEEGQYYQAFTGRKA